MTATAPASAPPGEVVLHAACGEESLEVRAGELVVALVDESADVAAWGEVLLGVRRVEGIDVRYLDRDWTSRDARDALAARRTIGRVFGRDAWLNAMTVEENVMLALLAAGGREDDARRRVRGLGETFGCAWRPGGRPEDLDRDASQTAQWVRALAGRPRLLVLERPLRGAAPRRAPLFMSSVRRLVDDGAGVVWFSARADVAAHPDIAPARVVRIARSPEEWTRRRPTR